MGEKIGIGIVIASLLIYVGILIFYIARRIIYKNKYKSRRTNQIEKKRGNLLPIYYMSKFGSKLVLLIIVSVIICIFLCMISLEYMLITFPIILVTVMLFAIVYLINFDIFGGLMLIKKKIEEKYRITNESISSNAIWLSKRDYFQTPTDRNMKNISFFNGHSYINMGAIHFNYTFKARNRMSYADLYNIYVEIKLSKTLEIYMLNKTYMENINETNSIVPIYNIIPPILFENTTKEHVEKFLNKDIQKCIADLAAKLHKYSIIFLNGKLTLVIHNACWSTFLSRVFTKEKCMNNILNSLDEIINTLEKISSLIEMNNNY